MSHLQTSPAGGAMRLLNVLLIGSVVTIGAVVAREWLQRRERSRLDLDKCPGYIAQNVKVTAYSLTAELIVAGPARNVYGRDLERLKLSVVYEESSRIHVKIADWDEKRYQVPESVLPRPTSSNVPSSEAAIQFRYTLSPFSFSIVRAGTDEVLFDTASYPLVFEPQFLRLKTKLPRNPNIYGLGEHTGSFRLQTAHNTRTLWSRDAFGVPEDTNLYGNHPVYYEHRTTGTHGVFLLNSNGMDIKLSEGKENTTLEYNIIGGVLDLYFLAGPTPADVARQYAKIVGLPASIPYWSLGFHQCRYGYKDYVEVANVVKKYAEAKIPLETMWIDIDYMQERFPFTNDPKYFPTKELRQIIEWLHQNEQHFILMVDPAVAYQPNKDYGAFDRGADMGLFLKKPDGSFFKGVVWPGVTVYPDWFHSDIDKYWQDEFKRFFNPETGFDIDGVWIDMNEPASFSVSPSDDPEKVAKERNCPPPRPAPPPAPGTPVPDFRRRSGNLIELNQGEDEAHNDALRKTLPHDQPSDVNAVSKKGASQQAVLQAHGAENLDSDVNHLHPPYSIGNAAQGGLSCLTAHTDCIHQNGLVEYDTHNLYGHMMSVATRKAMLARRPGLKPFIITRSTFSGTGHHTGKWLGDNLSRWDHYRFSIAGMLDMASLFQVPMVGSDVGGFGADTTAQLCARWATLGAFNPFYRNHNDIHAISQEFYLWPEVAQAAKNGIAMRYRLLDYLYTAFHQANADGTPVLNPMFFKYPKDANTFGIDLQFFYGDSILVSPVTEEDATSVEIYLPDDIFYDFLKYTPVRGHGEKIVLTDVDLTQIPVHIRGGAIIPLRQSSAMTTVDLRKQDFEIVVAPGLNGSASGELYIDDGVSLEQQAITDIRFSFSNGKLEATGVFEYETSAKVQNVTFLGVEAGEHTVLINAKEVDQSRIRYDPETKAMAVTTDIALQGSFTIELTV
ncbi:glycoside hydrolase family 31 protein [Botryobasidium botryosum FD-172 SS1]|uniref:Probable alpha/beta-glucosidase agdC n=1 Tax=Botryobasidium botryosum (strain FD-172 SS1) TaxID=930990 RepID=A0A067MWZ5_BOTB1|nr:glycoside hydrolase family 31 protein [Botryobasidium botryosum FD-172 SS1]